MGRGRAKAKQTKVARELKYSSHGTDFDALQRELSESSNGSPPSSESGNGSPTSGRADDTDDYDDWAADTR